MKIIREHVSLSKEHPFLISIFDDDQVDLSYPFHQHRYAYELTITLGLSGTRMVGDSTEQFLGQDVVLMAPGLPHCWQDHGIQSQESKRIVVIQFLDLLFSKELRLANFNKQIVSALENANFGLELIGQSKASAVRWANDLKSQNDFDAYVGLMKILHLFGSKNKSRRLCSNGYLKPEFKGETSRLKIVLEFIHNNYSRKLQVAEVAGQIHLSPSAFSHFFKKRTLKSFAEYVLDMRLGKAAQLLQHTDIQVTQVGYESGFQNISHFNRSFKKKYKQTPLKFRHKFRHLIHRTQTV